MLLGMAGLAVAAVFVDKGEIASLLWLLREAAIVRIARAAKRRAGVQIARATLWTGAPAFVIPPPCSERARPARFTRTGA